MAFGTDPTPQGLADPPIDDLMEHADSKYALAIFAAKRARQINSYFTQLNEGLLQNVGPLVEYQNQEKPLSIAFREIDSGLLEETLGEDVLSEGDWTVEPSAGASAALCRNRPRRRYVPTGNRVRRCGCAANTPWRPGRGGCGG